MESDSTPDFAPFELEPLRRADRAAEPPRSPPAHDEAMRLLRSPANVRDRSLSALAQAWIAALPADRRPTALAATYPRIANRIALCWRDGELTRLVFADLLGSRRRGRRGFPKPVHEELQALRDLAGHRPTPVVPAPRRIL